MSETVRVTVKLTPKASKNAVRGWAEGADGQKILKCAVTAAPEKGKANKSLISLLAAYWRIPRGDIQIVRGDTDRVKILEVRGLPYERLVDIPKY